MTQVQPLVCPSCNAPVPLGTGDITVCPYCQAAVPLPKSHIELRATQADRHTDRAQAEVLYRKLGSPPGVWLRLGGGIATWWTRALSLLLVVGMIFAVSEVWAQVLHDASKDFDLGAFCFLVFVLGVRFVAVFWGWVWHAAATVLHVDYADVWAGGALQAWLGLSIVVLIAIPTVLFQVAGAFGDIRKKVQGMLAATPPTTPGGPSLCRECGAPLDISPGDLGTRCVYCDTDNLIAIPAGLIKDVKKEERTFHQGIQGAEAEERRVRWQSRTTAFVLFCKYLMVVPVLFGLGFLADIEMEHEGRPPDFRQSLLSVPREMVAPEHGTLHAGEAQKFTFSKGESLDSGCRRVYFVALRRGETLTLGDLSQGLDVTVQTRHLAPWYRAGWTWQDIDAASSFTAPYEGWYRVRVHTRSPQSDASLTWSVK